MLKKISLIRLIWLAAFAFGLSVIAEHIFLGYLLSSIDFLNPGPNQILISEPFFTSEDENCELFGDWLSLGNWTFFKKSANYYLLDLNLIVLVYLRHHLLDHRFAFNLTVTAQLNARTFQLKRQLTQHQLFKVEKYLRKGNLESQTLVIRFRVEELLKNELNVTLSDIDGLKMSLDVFDYDLGQGLRTPLELNIKNSPHAHPPEPKINSSSVAVCNKMVFVDNDDQFERFQLWVNINKRLGYDKLIVYFRPGYQLEPKLRAFLQQHEGFLETRMPICFPYSFEPQPKRFFTRLDTLNDPYNLIFKSLAPAFLVYLKECYLDHFDQFRYIVAKDGDEIVFPMTQHQVSFTKPLFTRYRRTKGFTKREILQNFLRNSELKLTNAMNFGHQVQESIQTVSKTRKSAHLPYANFIKNDNFDRFCRAFRQKASEIDQSIQTIVFDQDEYLEHEMRFKVAIDMHNRSQVAYASHLCDLNEYLVKPWLNSPQLNPLVRKHARFFSSSNDNGKSIHSTNEILTFTVHFARVEYKLMGRDQVSLANVNHEELICSRCGLVVHLREKQKFKNPDLRDTRLIYIYNVSFVQSIENIHFDTFLFSIISTI